MKITTTMYYCGFFAGWFIGRGGAVLDTDFSKALLYLIISFIFTIIAWRKEYANTIKEQRNGREH